MKVTIVAKTRRGSRACIGAITEDGQSVRLIAADEKYNGHAGMEYEIGDVWNVEIEPPISVVPPHVEDVVVFEKQKCGKATDLIRTVFKHMPPISGGPDQLYGGLLQSTPNGALYIAEGSGVPDHSTTFWIPDKPLLRSSKGKNLRYCYPVKTGKRSLVYVGFQDPVEEIPAGSLLRVSLAHWWRPDDRPDEELRCYAQLSGWMEIEPSSTDRSNHEEENPMPINERKSEAQETLKSVFGYDNFWPLQTESIANILDGRDTLIIMPTGGGKSICYQLPALIFPGMTIVVSPLISLMQDQVSQLRDLGVSAAYLNSTLTYQAQGQIMQAARRGEIRLLYLAPETLLRPETLVLLDECQIDCLAIDEAHCISSWGHDFRPEYRQLRQVRERLPQAVCVALTATATPRVQVDIRETLGFSEANSFIGSFNRDNLFLSALPRLDGLGQLLAFLSEHRDQSGIIYCSTRKDVDALADRLTSNGWSALPYHAGLDAGTRRRNQEEWVRDNVQIMAATVAFGMGIDKSNVRFVVHYNLPQSVENYYQEIGRAGRDGLRADCLLLYSVSDTVTQRHFIDSGAESERAGRSARLQAMWRYAEAQACRRTPLLGYFGESFAEPCGFCDNCLHSQEEREQTDVTVAAQKFLSCVARTGELFGAAHIVNVLRGSQARRILDRGHDKLSTYGIGLEYSANEWKELAQQFISLGLLEQDMEYGSLKLTSKAHDVFRGEQVFITVRPKASVVREDMAHDIELFAQLRSLRKELADQANLPAYIVFSDRALVEMATYFPQNETQLLAINGVGGAKLERYGQPFLALLQDYCAEHSLNPRAKGAESTSAQRPTTLTKRRFEEVGERFAAGETIEHIRASYGVKQSTIIQHLAKYQIAGNPVDGESVLALSILTPKERRSVFAAFDEQGVELLSPVYESLHGSVDYEELHLLRIVYISRNSST